MPHSPELKKFTIGGFCGAELRCQNKGNGLNQYDFLYNYPNRGIALRYSSFGNNSVLGNYAALYPYITTPLTLNKKNNLEWDIGFGLAYATITNKTNELNRALGSHLNVFIQSNAVLNHRLNRNSCVFLRLGVAHLSNGKLASPNLGLNMLQSQLGYQYNFINEKPEFYEHKKLKPNAGLHYALTFAGAVKTPGDYTNNYYFASSIVLDADKWITNLNKIGLGINLFYDASIEKTLMHKKIPFHHYYLIDYGIHISHKMVYKKISWPVQIGYCFNASPDKTSPIFLRTGVHCSLSLNFGISAMIKSHFNVADYIEWGIGYSF